MVCFTDEIYLPKSNFFLPHGTRLAKIMACGLLRKKPFSSTRPISIIFKLGFAGEAHLVTRLVKTWELRIRHAFIHIKALQWRHNEHNDVPNHRRLDCLLNHLFRRGSKKTPKLRVIDLCKGNSPVTGEFPAQRASNAEMFPFDDVIMEWKPWM